MASAKVNITLPDISAALRAKLQRADDAIAEYEAQQQIIWILIERLGGSVTISDESMTTKRMGTIQARRGEFSVTLSLKRDEAVAA